MANISQHIPNYIKGISRQPDELKQPGQVRDAKNAIPDVTGGLTKRPGARLINPLGFDQDTGAGPGTTITGTWFDFYIDRNESYIGKIGKDGRVEIWSTRDGYPRVVKYSTTPQDFSLASDGESASSTCDSAAYKAARDALQVVDTQIEKLQVKIDKAVTEWDNYVEPEFSGTRADYEVAEIKIVVEVPRPGDGDDDEELVSVNGYIVDSAYVESTEKSRDGYPNESINPPYPSSTKGNIAVADAWVCTRENYENPGYQGFNRDVVELVFGPDVKANIFDWAEDAEDPNLPSVSKETIAEWEVELSALQIERGNDLKDFALAAAQCGQVVDPVSTYSKLAVRGASNENVLNYLRYQTDGDIKTLTTQDRVIVANRKVPVTLSSEVETVRPAEGYVEIKGLAGGRRYAFGVDLLDIDVGFSTMRASKLDVNKGVGWVNEDSQGACAYSATKVFENQTGGSTGKNLTFELSTVGSSRVKDPDDPGEGYECIYTTTVRLLNGGSGWKRGDKVKVTMNDFDYTLTISETIEEYSTDEVVIETGVFATDGDVELNTKMVLDALKVLVDGNSTLTALGFECDIIGNGLYLSNTSGLKFSLNSTEWDLLNCFGDQVNDVTQLPTQCKAGYVCKVANSDAEADDYYVQFYGSNGKPRPDGDITPKGALPNKEQENYVRKNYGTNGPGAWYECVKPGLANIINSSSMPHQIRKIAGIADTEFLVQPINWADREVGDDFTNPIPRFVGTETDVVDSNTGEKTTDLRYINNMIFYRSRLCFLTGEAVVLSQPIDNVEREQFNFWKKTATTLVDTDPIDLIVTSKNPAVLYDSIITNSGLLLFSANYQYLLSTNQDVLSPKTAEVNEIASYRYNERTKPISMGTTVAFLSNAGVNSRLFEMTNISRDQQAEVLEQSKIIADIIPNNLNLLTHSKENQVVIAGSYFDKELFLYRYFNDGVQRKQAAWVRWELTGELIYQSIIDDTLFIVVRNKFEQDNNDQWDVLTLQRVDLKESVWSAIVEDYSFIEEGNKEGRYQVHMDNYLVVWPTSLQYYPHLNQTYFRLPLGYFSDKRLAVYTLKYGKYQGRAAYPKVEIDNQGVWAVLNGNWLNTRMMIGYEFEYKVELPVIYPQQSSGDVTKSDVTGSLMLHRMHLSLGDHGVYETTLVRNGQEDYTQMYEARDEDGYLANDVAFDSAGTQTVPIYTRNTNFGPEPNGIFITSSHPAPCTLVSMTWEGDYTPKFYKRV